MVAGAGVGEGEGKRHRDERVNSGGRRVDAGATGREWRPAGKRMEIGAERWGHKGRKEAGVKRSFPVLS